jgi:hypothetical protein
MRSFFAVLLISYNTLVIAQAHDSTLVKRLSIRKFYFQSGLSDNKKANGTLNDFRKLAPTSVLLNRDFTGYQEAQGIITETTEGLDLFTDHLFCFMAGIKFRNKKKTDYRPIPELRTAISFFSGTALRGNLYKQVRKPCDSLNHIDSLITNIYMMRYHTKQLRLDIDLIFRTNPALRWSVYGGVGGAAGFSVNAQTDILAFHSRWKVQGEHNLLSGGSYPSEKEQFQRKNNLSLSAYLPVGVDFRLGKKSELMKRMHVYYELRAVISKVIINDLQTTSQTGLQHFIGLRISRD